VRKKNKTQEDINQNRWLNQFPSWILAILASPQGRLPPCKKRPFQI